MMAPAIRYEEARRLLDEAIAPLAKQESVLLADTLGRFAAEEVKSPLDLPHTRNAAVDGYAVSSAFLAANPDYEFPIIGIAKAGHPLGQSVPKDSAVRIFTGAIMPDGVDCVMMQEFCNAQDDKVRFSGPLEAGKNCRPAGENLHKGEVIVQKGECISPAHIGQAAAAGLTHLSVTAQVRVGILSTGDEVVSPSAEAHKEYGHIFDSNRPMIAALIKKAGHLVIDGGIIPDDKDALSVAYGTLAANCDVIISSGGASQGDEDHSQAALKMNGAQSLFWRVAIKPGRPVAASLIGSVPVFCLPGNPVAVLVCFYLFVKPVLDKLSHSPFKPLTSLKIKAGFSAKKAPNERAEFRRVKLALTNEGETVMLPHGRKGAGVLSSLTGADGLAELPYELGEVPEGQKLPFIML